MSFKTIILLFNLFALDKILVYLYIKKNMYNIMYINKLKMNKFFWESKIMKNK
jgi:hypothetical protein